MNNMNSATADTGASAELIQSLYRLIEEKDTQISELRKENISLKNYRIETERMNTQIAADYQTLNRKYENLLQENKQLKAILDKVTEKEKLKTQELFGRSSEKTDDVLNSGNAEEFVDEVPEEMMPSENGDNGDSEEQHTYSSSRPKGEKKTKKKEENFSNLPRQAVYNINFDVLDRKYGVGCWRIVTWHSSKTVEYPKMTAFVLETFTPVISVGLEHTMVSMPSANRLYPGSYVSASLFAEIVYQKFFQFVPTYRIEKAFKNMGLNISRQNICNWIIRFASEYFWMIYEYLIEKLCESDYQQCDETTYQVINDGRKAGAKSYIWVHRTSELCDCDPIIIYAYELTRGTDHLREFYKDFKGFISCDAYGAYRLLSKESAEIIVICLCLAHMRRRYVEAVALIDRKNISEEKMNELPEVKALHMINAIYKADMELKGMTPEERKEARNSKVRPETEKYFGFIESIDLNAAGLSEKCRDAVRYSLNNKNDLMNFLNDGNIPIDNNAAERSIKSVALLRKASLFSYSIEGAQANTIYHSIVETAKANGANVYWYIRYILETMPDKLDGKDRSFLSAMAPWSPEYKAYEKEHHLKLDAPYAHAGFTEKPKTPRKKDRILTA